MFFAKNAKFGDKKRPFVRKNGLKSNIMSISILIAYAKFLKYQRYAIIARAVAA
jgi:hypothetical protein